MFKDTWARSAAKAYKSLDEQMRDKLDAALAEILVDPFRAPNVKALKGPLRGKLRKRVGDLRIIYQVNAAESLVEVLVLANRKDAY